MSQNNPTGRERQDEKIVWLSLVAAGTVTLIFYIFILMYQG